MSRVCLYCARPFGMVRRGLDLKIGPFRFRIRDSKFCTDEHENLYNAERAEEYGVLRFHRWLYQRPP